MNDGLRRLDDYVEAYEVARASDSRPKLADFIPASDHPERFETVIELVRVDLEYSWRQGTGTPIEQYQQMFPDILQAGEGLELVAFEEYRLRRLAGESVSKEWYRQRYAITTDTWPDLPIGTSTLSASTLSYDDVCLHELSQIDVQLGERLAAATRVMPEIGGRFESFDLVGELGRGAFGRVFLAQQDDLAHRFVALKVTPHFSEEPQRLAQLQHTNIVPIYSVHRQGPLQAICMPFLGPNTLADVLRTFELSRSLPDTGQAIVSTIAMRSASTLANGGASQGDSTPLRNNEVSVGPKRSGVAIRRLEDMDYLTAVVWIISRVADGLAYAHEHGIVHRDLKPANILLTDDGEPLLLDFNLATEHSATGATMALIGGTLPYIGPEHMAALQHGGHVGPASDVYSLGVILFQMLTGCLPYPSPPGPFHELVTQLRQERLQPPPLARSLNPLVPPGLEAIIQRCLAPDPQHRYGNAREVQEDLQRHLEHRPLQHAPDRNWNERFRKWTRRHPRLASATTVAAIACVMIVALGTIAWTRDRRLAENEARDTLHQVESEVDAARTVLNSPFVDNRELDHGVTRATDTLQHLNISQATLQRPTIVRHLQGPEQQRLRQDLEELVYLAASGVGQQAVRSSNTSRRASRIQEALRWNAMLYQADDRSNTSQAILLQRARLLRAANQPAEAGKVSKQAEALTQGSTDQRALAFEYAQQGRFAAAASLLRRLVRQAPQSHTLWFCLGNCYLSEGRSDDAEECYTMAIALRPRFVLGYEHRGLARLQAERYQDACSDFDAALREHPELQSALVNRAIAREKLGATELALHDLNAAIEQGAMQTRIYFMRSRLRSELDDPAGAARDNEEGLRRTPQDELSWVARGVARLADDPTAALADFRQALKLNPHSRSALQNIAHVLSERLGDHEGAVKALDQLIAMKPPSASALAGRGVLLARQNQREPSLSDAAAALEANASPLILYQVGCIYALNTKLHPEDRPRALQLIAQALQRDSALVDIVSQDSDLTLLRDDDDFLNVVEAARLLQRTAKSQPTNSD